MIYGSVCSGIEAATAAWKPLGWRTAFFSDIEPFPSAVLAHHYPEVPNLGDMTKFRDWQIKRGSIDVLVGGTPCQSFSVAGLRKGMADPRGNLALVFLGITDRLRPRWVVWENVPGVLSSLSHESPNPRSPAPSLDMERDGQEVDTEDEYTAEELHAFNCFVAGLSELGYGWAMRILDAQHFGVPQRRRRVFVVGYLGDWRRAAAVLFERESLSGNPPPRREAREGIAPTISARTKGGGGLGTDFDCDGGLISCPLTGNPYGDNESRESLLITHSLRADGFDASEDGMGRGTPLVIEQNNVSSTPDLPSCRAHTTPNYAIAFRVHGEHSIAMTGNGTARVADPVDVARCLDSCGGYAANQGGNIVVTPILEAGARTGKSTDDPRAGIGIGDPDDPMFTLQSGKQHAIAFTQNQGGDVLTGDIMHAPGTNGNATGRNSANVKSGMRVRRLTPRECERLQGFPDDFTLIPWRKKMAPDGPRYKSLGNSMAVPVMRWIGERIQMVESLTQKVQ
jgi:DNA (cytosine-5)-methyltransferase 1